MKPLVVDKISSVTLNCRLGREVRVGNEFACEEGDVVAVRVLSRKSTYNQIELTTGRFSHVKPGDVVAGALGHRNALFGYAGHMPEKLETGQMVHLLNLGGVIGVCDSFNPDVGAPCECEVLGQVLHFPYVGERVAVPANIGQMAAPMSQSLACKTPVVAVVGTSMSSGKTFACTSLIQELVRKGMKVAAAKATGVSLRRDVLAMEDAGAFATTTFTDYGVVTTTRDNAPSLAKSMLNDLHKMRPDVIVLELGDGLLGTYGVDAILEAEDIRDAFGAVVLAAHDPVGVWGGVRRLKEAYDIDTTVITGPATDNAAGTGMVDAVMKLPAYNARVEPEDLVRVVSDALEKERAASAD